MKKFIPSLLLLAATILTARAESFSGPGPDAGGDGSALTIQFEKDKPVFFENGTFNADKTYIVRLRPDAKGEWNVAILVYSAHGSEQTPPVADKLLATYKFAASDTAAGLKADKELVVRDKVDWPKEPARLLKFYKKHKSEFEKNADDFDPSKQEDK
ncbi:MAG: hypothetical protein ACREKL_00410 [Chthoniobacterales bacterium]